MSSYVNFYLRINDNFAPIGSYSRSSSMYQAMSNVVPYEKIVALRPNQITEVIHNLEESAARMRKVKENDRAMCDKIMNTANNSIEDKLSAIAEIESNFDEMDSYIEEVNFAADTLRVFLNMIDDFRYSDECRFDNDYFHYIYAGIESYGRMEDVADEE